MPHDLSGGAIEVIVSGREIDTPVLQILSTKKISSPSSSDRYRLLLSDGLNSYSHAMLATQLNDLMEREEMDNLCVVKVNKYICNTLQGDRRVLILLDVEVLAKGSEVNERIGNPQAYKPGESNSAAAAPAPTVNGVSNPAPSRPAAPVNNVNNRAAPGPLARSPPSAKPGAYNIKAGSGPGTPNSRIHSIVSLTPYQNRWRIRARVTQKSNIRTWSNSRGEGKLFSVNFLDESGEIRATGFTDVVDKFYNLLEVNKVFFVSRATLKTANKQYSTVNNDYEMTFNQDTLIEPCDDITNLPTMTFDFVKINALEAKQTNTVVDVVGVVKNVGDVTTITGKQSQREVSKRELQVVDQTGMAVQLTLWGSDAENYNSHDNPVIACKGCKLSDWGGRSLSLMSGGQMILNPDIREAHVLKGWWDHEGQSADFTGYRSEGGSNAGSNTNWKTFVQVKTDNLGQGEKPDYFTSRGTVIFLRKENSMYKACPTESCNKKMVDQGNGMYRCEKCAKEFPNFKWRMILSANVADYTENQWVTCFQESAETLLRITADELGNLRETDEQAYDDVFTNANFRPYIFRMRAKMETYNDESRLKTICVNATSIDWVEDGKRLLDSINKLLE